MSKHHTKAGSTVEISESKYTVCFDWLEEPNACFECKVNPYPEDGYLTWYCILCGGGQAELFEEQLK